MFDNFRQALNDVLQRGTPPDARRALLAHMRETLAQARVGVDDLRRGVEATRARLAAEQRELDTVTRRQRLADGIGDAETVAVADRFVRQHHERVQVLTDKLAAQERELALTDAEVTEMGEALRRASKGVPPVGAAAPRVGDQATEAAEELERELGGPDPSEFDALRRQHDRSARESDAARRLEELKRRMGK